MRQALGNGKCGVPFLFARLVVTRRPSCCLVHCHGKSERVYILATSSSMLVHGGSWHRGHETRVRCHRRGGGEKPVVLEMLIASSGTWLLGLISIGRSEHFAALSLSDGATGPWHGCKSRPGSLFADGNEQTTRLKAGSRDPQEEKR